jgi:hypothetical protein
MEVYMEKIKNWLKNKWFRRVSVVILGTLLGFAYYYFIGCTGGTCPITSNPYISTGYGSLLGLVLASGVSGGKQTGNAG